MEQDKPLQFAILEYLKSLKGEEGVNEEALTAATDSLRTAFDLDADDGQQFEKLSYHPNSLSSLFGAGVQSLKAKKVGEDMAELQGNPAFRQFMDKIKEKGFFRGVEEGSKAYYDRYFKAAAKFREKLKDSGAGASRSAAGREPTEAELAQAEELKAKGNEAIKSKDYKSAESLYSEAIALAPRGPNTHIYYCNRAAARSYFEDYAAAVEDCEEALKLDPNYVKAYSRLGMAHFTLGQYEEAVRAYKKGLELEPGNSSLKDGLQKAEGKLMPSASDLPPSFPNLGGLGGLGGAGGMPDLSALGGAGGLGSLLQNPALMNMAQQMMQNPAMMAQAQQMMQNPAMRQQAESMMRDPAALSRMMGAMGGLGGAGQAASGEGSGESSNGGTPNLADLMAQFQRNEQGGPDSSPFNPGSI